MGWLLSCNVCRPLTVTKDKDLQLQVSMPREAPGETLSAPENFSLEATYVLPACLSVAKASYVVTYKFKRKGVCRNTKILAGQHS